MHLKRHFTQGFTHWWRSVIEIVSIYTLFFFASNAILLLSFIWASQYKIKHLNQYIENLIKSNERPDVSDVEIVKTWYVTLHRIPASSESLAYSLIINLMFTLPFPPPFAFQVPEHPEDREQHRSCLFFLHCRLYWFFISRYHLPC